MSLGEAQRARLRATALGIDAAVSAAPSEPSANISPQSAEVKAEGAEKKPHPVRLLHRYFAAGYDLIHTEGRAYAVPREHAASAGGGPRGVAQAFGPDLRRRIVERSQHVPGLAPITKTTADNVLAHLEVDAFRGPETSVALRFAEPEPDRLVIDLGGTDGSCIEITTGGWAVRPAPDGVVFRRSHAIKPLPAPVRGGCLDALAHVLDLDPGSEVFRGLIGWLVGLPFAASVRPGLLLLGAPGRGKSTRLRLLASVLEPSPAHALGSAFGRNLADDQVRALHRAVPLWDNLTSVSGAVSDELCTLVTGTARETRTLYSDNALNVVPIARPLGLSAVGLPAGLRPDALDRLLTLEVPTVSRRRSDAEVQRVFDSVHGLVLGALCDALVCVLQLRSVVDPPTTLRMAGHAQVLAALDMASAAGLLPGCPPRLLEAYASAVVRVKQRTASEDTFGAALLELLDRAGGSWSGKASELLTSAGVHAGLSDRGAGWPTSARRVPEVLNHLRDGLATLGVDWTTTTVRGSTRYHFTAAVEGPGTGR